MLYHIAADLLSFRLCTYVGFHLSRENEEEEEATRLRFRVWERDEF